MSQSGTASGPATFKAPYCIITAAAVSADGEQSLASATRARGFLREPIVRREDIIQVLEANYFQASTSWLVFLSFPMNSRHM